jgi:hypothetical protein
MKKAMDADNATCPPRHADVFLRPMQQSFVYFPPFAYPRDFIFPFPFLNSPFSSPFFLNSYLIFFTLTVMSSADIVVFSADKITTGSGGSSLVLALLIRMIK